MREEDYIPLIERALREDLGDQGDVTSLAVVPDIERSATLWSKDVGVLAGAQVFAAVFRAVDPRMSVQILRPDGSVLAKGDPVARVAGKALALLSAERTALNFISFLSGIATSAHTLAAIAAESGHAKILDTRKTLPGWRALSKYAVSVGGGRNHRQGLYDMVLIKDNHIDSAGSLTAAVRKVRDRWGTQFRVEVECRTTEEVQDALAAGVDMIMLDNMEPERMREEVRRIAGRAEVEASGNMSAERIPAVSATGVDYISVGAITHSVRSFDFSLKIDRGKESEGV